MRLYFLGQCAHDIIYPIDEPILENQKYRCYEKQECAGGPACNAALLCGSWNQETAGGSTCVMISRVGADSYGQEILTALKDRGVDPSFVAVSRGNTALSSIAVNRRSGTRTIFNAPMAAEQSLLPLPQERADYLYSDGHEIGTMSMLMDRNPQSVSVLDAGTWRPELQAILPRISYLICSGDFAYQFTGLYPQEDTVRRIFDQLAGLCPGQIAVTAGSDGLYFQAENSLFHMGAYAVPSIDTTGAGDIFHGAFLWELTRGVPYRNCLAVAAAAAALSTMRIGGSLSIPACAQAEEKAGREALPCVKV